MKANSGYKVTIGIRHYVAKKDEWIDKEVIELPKNMAQRFYEMLKRFDPESIARLK